MLKEFIKYFIESGGYFSNQCEIRWNEASGYGLYKKNNQKIIEGEKIIHIPKKLFLDYNQVKNLINNPLENNNGFIREYFSKLPSIDDFKKKHILLQQDICNDILQVFKYQTYHFNYYKKLIKKLHSLKDPNELYLEMLFLTRAYNFQGGRFLVPMADIVNYNFNGQKFLSGDSGVSLYSKGINENQEIFCNYGYELDPLTLYFKYSIICSSNQILYFPKDTFVINAKSEIIDKDVNYINGVNFYSKELHIGSDAFLCDNYKNFIDKFIGNTNEALFIKSIGDSFTTDHLKNSKNQYLHDLYKIIIYIKKNLHKLIN